MNFNIAVCDDNAVDLKTESELIKQCFDAKKLSCNIKLFNTAKDLIKSDIKYDIIFLDIEMEDMNGIEVAERIHRRNRKCLMFFVTNYETYMDSAMDEHAFRFWTKPINKDRLMHGIESAIGKIKSYNMCITVSVNRQKISIPITKIIFMAAENKKTRIIATDSEFVINEPLKTIKSRIKSFSFCESHASFYVNLNYVKEYTHTDVICAYKQKEYKMHISRRKYTEFNKHFIDWMGGTDMRIDVGLILGVAIEYIIMLYYANTTLYPKKNYYISSIVALVGYVTIFIISIFGQPAVNTVAFTMINFMIFLIGYHINCKSAIFQSVILTILIFLGEIIPMFILGIGFNANDITALSVEKSILITIAGKLIYFIGIIIIKNLGHKKEKRLENSCMVLILIPVVTFVCIVMVMDMCTNKQIFSVLCILSLAINIVTFSVNEFIISKNNRIRVLEEENSKNCNRLKEYRTLEKEYEQIRIINHDFREHVRTLNTLIDEDIAKAKEYIQSMELVSEKSKSIRFTDNTILNILLNEKVKECSEKGIKLYIESANPKLNFISEIDIVAVFSNLINNAIEACADTDDKEIFMNLCTVNGVFTVIKIENSADREPIVLEGMLRTHKDNKYNHGIGIKSIENSLKKYNGNMSWTYDKLNRIFRTTVIINTKSFVI